MIIYRTLLSIQISSDGKKWYDLGYNTIAPIGLFDNNHELPYHCMMRRKMRRYIQMYGFPKRRKIRGILNATFKHQYTYYLN